MKFPALSVSALALCAAISAPSTAMEHHMKHEAHTAPKSDNYFAAPSTLPFQAPDFTKITEDMYVPAFQEGMKQQRDEINAIIKNKAKPTFENTIVALEDSGAMLSRVSTVFFALTGSNTNDNLDAIEAKISPELTAHGDAINLDPKLFKRVQAVYNMRAKLKLDTEDMRLLETTYDNMVHAGAKLDAKQKTAIKTINTELSDVTTQFGQVLRAAAKESALVVDSREELAGLSDAEIDTAAAEAKSRGLEGKFVIPLQNTTQQPLLPALSNRATREKLFKASVHRADNGGANDTRMLIARIAQLRADKAALFGQPNWASYAMYDRMAKTPKTALDFMEQMVGPLAETQRRDAGELNAQIKAGGEDFEVKPWDWYRYAERVRKAKYDIDEDAVKPYFEITQVLENGVFFAANKLYGLSFTKRTDLPVYHKDVTVYTVHDRDGSELGVFYFDPYQRPSKGGGAWMSNFVDQSHRLGTKPVIYNVLNIPKAGDGEPQLVSYDNVETMFHEFGHALHGFFANQKYRSLSGTATARDFVEYPSQVNEIWASYPEVLANYAKHIQTGAAIPAELIAKIKAASKFNQGYDFGEVVEAALLDMKWHALSPEEAKALKTPEDVDNFERKSLLDLGLEIDLVPPRYRSTYFNHIFSGPSGYSAGYYSYLWTAMLDRDSRKWFLDNGGLTRANGDHFRDTVLSRGGTMDYFEMFRNFAGREPDVQPLMESHGLTGE